MDYTLRQTSGRIAREKRTVAVMVSMYCQTHHDTSPALCGPCARLVEYAFCRLDQCPFGVKKTPCGQCPVHCYGPTMRTRIKDVMKYAGPRMIFRHPILALVHQWDKFRSRQGTVE